VGQIAVNVFAAAEYHPEAHFVASRQETPGISHLVADVMLACLWPQTDLLDTDRPLGFPRLALSTGALIGEFAVVDQSADWWICIGRHFDQVQASTLCNCDGLARGHDA